ncbi:MAG: 2-oxo acid dehydrogenase subunit E2 [Holosporales bacterium]|jgi:pyruvate dehydrogenase E2 component (dihydrolipoamide acetyltransferase)|nr:2-oxo acid dehydrogenase subunit E2 [Holosporales bacterium]
MPIILEMPTLSPSMEKGNLINWLKKEGDSIEIGEVIAEIDTDKATMEVESMYEGILEKILVPAGTFDVLIKTPIAIIKQKNEKYIEPALQEKERVKASPLAKRIANEYDIELSKLTGSGPGGRIIKSDVLEYSEQKLNKAEIPQIQYIDEQISNLRKVIAEKLTKSKQDTPHFYMNVSANVSELFKIRKLINDSGSSATKITVNDFIIKAVALALCDSPEINVSWTDGKIRKYSSIDISVAVAIDEGLFTPIIRNVNCKSLKEISQEMKDLADKAKSGKLLPDEFIGGGITISNLGMYQIDNFSSIINPPQGSILSIGPAKKTPIFDDENNIIAAQIMNIGYAIDHRVIDGSAAAKFLEKLSKYLQSPMTLVL